MERLVYDNIFDAITDDPLEAADLQFRADLMLVLREMVTSNGWSQAQTGEKLGIPQPRVSDLMRGKVDKFSSDKLISYLFAFGFQIKPKFVAHPRGRETAVKCMVTRAELAYA